MNDATPNEKKKPRPKWRKPGHPLRNAMARQRTSALADASPLVQALVQNLKG